MTGDGIDVLPSYVDQLRIENARLRAEVDGLNDLCKKRSSQLGQKMIEATKLLRQHDRLVAACRALRVVNGGCVGWSGSPAVIAEFDAAVTACEEACVAEAYHDACDAGGVPWKGRDIAEQAVRRAVCDQRDALLAAARNLESAFVQADNADAMCPPDGEARMLASLTLGQARVALRFTVADCKGKCHE